MDARGELLICGCRDDDVDVLAAASGPEGPALRSVSSVVKLAEQAVASRRLLAVVIGVGVRTTPRLEVIPVLKAIRKNLPVIVIADEDSLAVERAARQSGIFYYLVHPIEAPEVVAVLESLMRACA